MKAQRMNVQEHSKMPYYISASVYCKLYVVNWFVLFRTKMNLDWIFLVSGLRYLVPSNIYTYSECVVEIDFTSLEFCVSPKIYNNFGRHSHIRVSVFLQLIGFFKIPNEYSNEMQRNYFGINILTKHSLNYYFWNKCTWQGKNAENAEIALNFNSLLHLCYCPFSNCYTYYTLLFGFDGSSALWCKRQHHRLQYKLFRWI